MVLQFNSAAELSNSSSKRLRIGDSDGQMEWTYLVVMVKPVNVRDFQNLSHFATYLNFKSKTPKIEMPQFLIESISCRGRDFSGHFWGGDNEKNDF